MDSRSILPICRNSTCAWSSEEPDEEVNIMKTLDSILATAQHRQSAASWLSAPPFKPLKLLCAQCEHRGLVFSPQSSAEVGVPSIVLEVAVFNDDGTELEALGSEWMDLLQVQAAIVVKIHHEENPIDDCPKISVGFWARHRGQKCSLLQGLGGARNIYQAKRQKLEAASAAALPAPHAQGSLELIADRAKQTRGTC
ncbi:hypothetical protein WJX77_004952 [Trebouxia sp. C0004]